MAIEARLEWRAAGIAGVDRLIVPDAAARSDGRWQRAAGQALAEGEAELDPAPWLQPAGLDVVSLPRAGIRLATPLLPGRHYPRLAFPGLASGPRDVRPVRVLAVDDERVRVDPNHPLAGRAARLRLLPSRFEAAPGIRLIELFDGPGLQAPAPPGLADDAYFRPEHLARQDESPDGDFYAGARLTHHLDAACRDALTTLHGRFLQPGQCVLDLMASWDSHLPTAPAAIHVAGLGLNAGELAANPRLAERVVKDLNARPELPWNDARFDLAICVAAIEYLIQPRVVLAELRRVLKPGAWLVVSFSDRWFPPKAVRIWSELHPFERVAWVASLFAGAGFVDVASESLRGLKRPEDDKYAAQRAHADPLFAVWARVPE